MTRTCARCSGPIVTVNGGRPPKFCSDTCRRGNDASRKRHERLESRNQKPTLEVRIPDVGLFSLRYAEQTVPMDGFWESECFLLALAGELYDMPVNQRTDFACRAIEARVNGKTFVLPFRQAVTRSVPAGLILAGQVFIRTCNGALNS